MTVSGWGVLEHARQFALRGEAFALATVVWRQRPSSGKEGCRALITADGAVHGWIGGACAEPVVIREARRALESGESRLLLLGPSDELGDVRAGVTAVPISCQSEGSLEIYVEPVLPTPHLYVVGDSPMVRALVEIARAVDWRAELGSDTDDVASGMDERSLVVVATQGRNDEAALQAVLRARPAYVGLVASARRGAAVLGYLADRGVAAEQLDRIWVPAGLDLGSTAHREIAVAIMAELVRLRAAGEFAPAPHTAEKAESIDPVCGMTVDIAGAERFDHAGMTYYFCRPGCRDAFERNPEAYLKEAAC